MRKKLIMGNWKMNGDRALLAAILPALQFFQSAEVAICSPFVWLSDAVKIAGKVAIGAQNVSVHESG